MVDIKQLLPGDEALLTQAALLFEGAALPPASAHAFLAAAQNYFFCAHADGELVGWVAACLLPRLGRKEILLHQIDVVEAQQRRGIATQLIRTLLDLARKKGMHAVILSTERQNRPAIRLYEALGAERNEEGHVFYRFMMNGEN